MGSDEAERRIEAARQEAARQEATKEFLESLTSADELVRHIHNPEAFAFREKARGQAARGELERTACRHPMARMHQYVDDDPLRPREGRPLNLFECGDCHMRLWLVDPWGDTVTDS